MKLKSIVLSLLAISLMVTVSCTKDKGVPELTTGAVTQISLDSIQVAGSITSRVL